MLRKILITLVVIGMAVTFGCKKTSDTTTKKTVTTTTKEIQKTVPITDANAK